MSFMVFVFLIVSSFMLDCCVQFNSFLNFLGYTQDVRVIFRRRGGDDLEQDHSMWLRTVWSSPDVIQMTFCPITDLIDEVPGKEQLTHAIGLYLECKPVYPSF